MENLFRQKEEPELPKRYEVATKIIGGIGVVVVGIPIYIAGFVALLTDWITLPISIDGWAWAFAWIWIGVAVSYAATWITFLGPGMLVFGLITKRKGK